MKLFHYLPVGACAAAAALLLASCGVSKRSLKQSNRALTAALQASAQKEQAEALKLYSDTSIPQGEARKSVSRDNPGQTALEQTIIRWAIDSDPQGARVFYRVLSSIPAVVKNTNETYLMTTPYEETRAFNILGLTYENSRDVQIEIKVVKTGCFGLCELGPIMIVYPEGTFYSRVTEADVTEIVEEHLLKGRVVERLVYNEPAAGSGKHEVASLSDTGFYKTQMRVALRNCGVINPEEIDEYIGVDGYQALGTVLTSMRPEEVIDLMKRSGLRGRGGAGFPTGKKWQFAAASKAALDLMLAEPERVAKLQAMSHEFVRYAKEKGLATGAADGYAVVPVMLGSSLLAGKLATRLFARHVNVMPIIYPVVEEGAARLRFFLSAAHDVEHIHRAIDIVCEELPKAREEVAAMTGA